MYTTRKPPIKGIGPTESTADRCVLLLIYAIVVLAVVVEAAAATASSSAMIETICTAEGAKQMFEGGGMFKKNNQELGGFRVTYSARRGGEQFLVL